MFLLIRKKLKKRKRKTKFLKKNGIIDNKVKN